MKKEISIADRKLAARNERIQQLEALLQHSQEELIKQNRKLGEQINLLRERLQQATSLRSQRVVPVSFARIARPVRGGGGEAAPTDCQTNTLASSTEKNKRGSWI